MDDVVMFHIGDEAYAVADATPVRAEHATAGSARPTTMPWRRGCWTPRPLSADAAQVLHVT